MFELQRLIDNMKDELRKQSEDLGERQKWYEKDLNRRLGNFQTIFYVGLTLVGLIVTGFGVVVFFIGRGG